ncbi:unnamed protein product [Adineta ricciae]|uniref:G-protein coupled receptors family 1 profile domain-containing protein n=1 Tax=Adineta ricciae TaxID=249248 RepID=A0A813WY98_ADIRI|nr:unnamed protein product [Adineta ricciae]CAF1430696.1 unnamed protein product [Adineta ricciae]
MSYNNSTVLISTTVSAKTLIDTLNLILTRFINYLPLPFVILGSIGFIGNSITFLQPTLRTNTCCIYTLCSSFIDVCNLIINLLPNYLGQYDISWFSRLFSRVQCKFKLFAVVFLPQLSINLLLLSLIDRFASTLDLTSSIRRICQRNKAPYFISLNIIISGLMSLQSPILNDVIPFYMCSSTNPVLSSVLYSLIHGIAAPAVMLIFVLLTYRNVIRSRQRVGVIVVRKQNRSRNRFVGMIFVQIFGTAFFCLQWLGMYIYWSATQNNTKSYERIMVEIFVFILTNNLYYLNNVKSFYLSTLVSHRFRKAFVEGMMRGVTCGRYRRREENHTNFSMSNKIRGDRKARLPS